MHRHRLAAQQRHDRVECFFHAWSLRVGGNAEHVRVGCQLPGTATEHGTAAGQMVE
jgi:hypothetical protein